MDGPAAPVGHGPLPRCSWCGELIGVYEPLLIQEPEGARLTSLAAEPELEFGEWPCRHPTCADTMSDNAQAAT